MTKHKTKIKFHWWKFCPYMMAMSCSGTKYHNGPQGIIELRDKFDAFIMERVNGFVGEFPCLQDAQEALKKEFLATYENDWSSL